MRRELQALVGAASIAVLSGCITTDPGAGAQAGSYLAENVGPRYAVNRTGLVGWGLLGSFLNGQAESDRMASAANNAADRVNSQQVQQQLSQEEIQRRNDEMRRIIRQKNQRMYSAPFLYATEKHDTPNVRELDELIGLGEPVNLSAVSKFNLGTTIKKQSKYVQVFIYPVGDLQSGPIYSSRLINSEACAEGNFIYLPVDVGIAGFGNVFPNNARGEFVVNFRARDNLVEGDWGELVDAYRVTFAGEK